MAYKLSDKTQADAENFVEHVLRAHKAGTLDLGDAKEQIVAAFVHVADEDPSLSAYFKARTASGESNDA